MLGLALSLLIKNIKIIGKGKEKARATKFLGGLNFIPRKEGPER